VKPVDGSWRATPEKRAAVGEQKTVIIVKKQFSRDAITGHARSVFSCIYSSRENDGIDTITRYSSPRMYTSSAFGKRIVPTRTVAAPPPAPGSRARSSAERDDFSANRENVMRRVVWNGAGACVHSEQRDIKISDRHGTSTCTLDAKRILLLLKYRSEKKTNFLEKHLWMLWNVNIFDCTQQVLRWNLQENNPRSNANNNLCYSFAYASQRLNAA